MVTCLHIVGGLVLAGALLGAVQAHAKIGPSPGEPVAFSDLASIGDVLASAKDQGRVVHIVYVHGMRADESGASSYFREQLGKSAVLKGFTESVGNREPLWRADDEAPGPITFAGTPLVGSDAAWREAWKRSIPFVIRSEFSNGKQSFKIVVDEVNWWPLLIGLKCRALVEPDSLLSGPRKRQIDLCASDNGDLTNGDPYYPWLSAAQAKEIASRRPPLGRAAWANRYLKQEIANWGLADAVIALGTMRHYLRKTMDLAAQRADPGTAARERILIAESLGSFVALDAARDSVPARELIAETRHFYFLANQFALLELARVQGPPASPGLLAEQDKESLLELLDNVAGTSPKAAAVEGGPPAQIVAISDPSDVLTFRVPELKRVAVSNVQWRFSGGPLGLFAHPLKAHRGGVEGTKVWKYLLRRNSDQAR